MERSENAGKRKLGGKERLGKKSKERRKETMWGRGEEGGREKMREEEGRSGKRGKEEMRKGDESGTREMHKE